MNQEGIQSQLTEAQATIRALQEELAETNHGLVALAMELEQRVEARTEELGVAHEELKKTNSELMRLTLELDDRIQQRTVELAAANESLKSENAERKRAEESLRQSDEALRKLNEDLERRVIERTEQLDASNKELEAFSYSVSHDLRAPLRAIAGFSRALAEDCGDMIGEDGRRVLKVVQDSVRDMGQLIDDLLAFSRLGRKEIKTSKINMRALAMEVFEQIQRGEPERVLRLNLEALPPAHGDRAMLREVFINLLSNAVKFTKPRAEAVIEASGRLEGDEIIFSVKDNGVGFDMRYVGKLFCVFQRLHSAAQFEGTGIGLALVQRIILRHGGRVWAEGKVNEGATFYFTLPNKETLHD